MQVVVAMQPDVAHAGGGEGLPHRRVRRRPARAAIAASARRPPVTCTTETGTPCVRSLTQGVHQAAVQAEDDEGEDARGAPASGRRRWPAVTGRAGKAPEARPPPARRSSRRRLAASGVRRTGLQSCSGSSRETACPVRSVNAAMEPAARTAVSKALSGGSPASHAAAPLSSTVRSSSRGGLHLAQHQAAGLGRRLPVDAVQRLAGDVGPDAAELPGVARGQPPPAAAVAHAAESAAGRARGELVEPRRDGEAQRLAGRRAGRGPGRAGPRRRR